MRLRDHLFPATPRTFRGRRELKIVLRAVHILCVGTYVGSYVFDVGTDDRTPWFLATLVSGVAMLLLDLHETCAFLLQVRGAVVLGKILVVAMLPWFAGAEAVVLFALVFVSVVSSHAPSRIRYHLLLGAGRVAAGRVKG